MRDHQTPATSKKGKKHLKYIFASETRKKKDKSKNVRSLELLLVFCGLIGARCSAAGTREEFVDAEAETYGAETCGGT